MNMIVNKEISSLKFHRKSMSVFSIYLFISQIIYINEIYLENISNTLFIFVLCVFTLSSLIWFVSPRPIHYLFISLSWIANVIINPGINSISTSIFIVVNLILFYGLFFKKISIGKLIDLCLIYLAVIYFISGLGKMGSKTWLSGDAVFILLNSFISRIYHTKAILNLISHVDFIINWSIMIGEVTLPVLLIFTKYKKSIIDLLILFHLLIAIFFHLVELTIPLMIILIMLRMQFASDNKKSI